jgi:FMN reductase
MSVVIVVGNPKPSSRTRAAAERVALRLLDEPAPDVVELAALGPALLSWGDDAVTAAKQRVLDADVAIFASPTFKATYTGLLKLFLEQFAAGELYGLTSIAVMLGGSPYHSLAPELTLKPVLSEIGASCPLPGLYLIDATWESDGRLDAWIELGRKVLGR